MENENEIDYPEDDREDDLSLDDELISEEDVDDIEMDIDED